MFYSNYDKMKNKMPLSFAAFFVALITAVCLSWFLLRDTTESYCPPAETTKVYGVADTTNQTLTMSEYSETVGKKTFFNGKEIVPYFATAHIVDRKIDPSAKLFAENFSLNLIGVTSTSIIGYNLGAWWKLGNYVYTFIEPSEILYRLPPRIGLFWEQKGYVKTLSDYYKTISTPYEGGEIITYKSSIVGKEKIEVPAGTFNCWKIETTATKSGGTIFATGTEWIAKRIGRIKYVRICAEDNSRLEVMLRSYRFRKK